MSFSDNISETFTQIEAAGNASMSKVNMSITDGGNVIGQGVTGSSHSLNICGGNLDNILESFGGMDVEGGSIEGGAEGKMKHKVTSIMHKTKQSGDKVDKHLEHRLKELHDHAVDLEDFAVLAKAALKEPECSKSVHDVLEKIVSHVDMGARAMRSVLEKDLKQPKQKVSEFLARNKQFANAIHTLGANLNGPNLAGMVSLSFSNVNDLKKMGAEVATALKAVDMTKKEYLGQTLSQLDSELTHELSELLKKKQTSDKLRKFLKGWKTLLEHHGHAAKLSAHISGGAMGDKLAERLFRSREELKNIVNKFIAAFGSNLNDIVENTNEMAKHLGKDIPYTDETIQFLDAFTRLNEYLSANKNKFYQHLLEINQDQVDSQEIKARFLSNLRVLADKTREMGSAGVLKKFASECDSTIETVHKFSDMIKSFREEAKKEGGNATDVMNELYSIDASKIEISALVNPLENLQIAIKKLQFFRNIALFRSNLAQTGKELAGYSKDYEKSVGKSIGEAISRITNEYNEIINQISDNKSGMGLEIDMYNESLDKNLKISKEKLKMQYTWQKDARVGLYKTIEAIDLYLLHFTDAISKNPDAVADLHKLLSATRIIAKWYDVKAGDNLIRVFESFKTKADGTAEDDEVIESDVFVTEYAGNGEFADLEAKLGGERASKVYERCRRAVQGVVVLKNIISYFISLGEKYGDFKSEKSIYMAPSNIYKNLVNYIWVSALDVNTSGTEVLTDNNETKRLLTYEDTKVKLAQVSDTDPETMGLNFNRHSIDKLRILKSHNELMRLKDHMISMTDLDIKRLKQFVAGTFARLGKTDYIFNMFLFGVYDLSVMDTAQIGRFIEFIRRYVNSANVLAEQGANNYARLADGVRASIQFVLPGGVMVDITADDVVATLSALSPTDRNNVSVATNYNVPERNNNTFVTLRRFMTIDEADYSLDTGLVALNGMTAVRINNGGDRQINPYLRSPGFMQGFLNGLTSNAQSVGSVNYAQRVIGVLHFCVMNMLNDFKRAHTSSVFAIDDTYFILTVKAIAGKIMTIAGVNSLFKNPAAYRNTLVKNQTRLIMGGADSILADPEVIDDAVELYVRLPLLVEFYRSIFDNANKGYKQESLNELGALDEEQISFVPEVGNIWSGLIKNIFDKSKHIENGVYTIQNMRKIVSEINAIHSHYKSKVPAESLTRHIVMELVAEINRRYGVIKRQELLNYYRVLNSTKRNKFEITEANYSNNDFDILNEEIEFEEKSPSDDFLNLKSALASAATPEMKINKLTDYKILKNFRERIQSTLNVAETALHVNDDASQDFLTMIDRIRLLKKAVSMKGSRDEKYDLIIKAIEEADAMNQSSNDIFACFHEFVVVPLRTTYQMYKTLDQFLLSLYSVMRCVIREFQNPDGTNRFAANPLLTTQVRIDGRDMTFLEAIQSEVLPREVGELSTGEDRVLTFGRGIAKYTAADDNTRTIQDRANGPINTGTAQLLITDIISRFCHNSGDLAKVTISTTGRITIDLSEFQTLSEYMVSNVKYMVDKFSGLVPRRLIENVTASGREGTVYWLENKLVNQMFNKLNKSESERSLLSLDNLNKIMPILSAAIFDNQMNVGKVITEFALNKTADDTFGAVPSSETLPVIRDAFMQYDQTSRIFKTDNTRVTNVYNTLFNPRNDSSIVEQNPRHGLIQEFNTLIAHYLNDLYDVQSRKMYPKLFQRFANNAFLEALNGQSFGDFAISADNAPLNIRFYGLPSSHGILSGTLAYVMKTMSTRTHPISGVKIHEIGSLQDVGAHVLEKYRACLPMYLRLFKIFLARCKFYRKILAKSTVDPADVVIPALEGGDVPDVANIGMVRENSGDDFIRFASQFTSINGSNGTVARDRVLLFIDDIVSGIGSLIEDASDVHKELREMDNSVPLFFDIKKDYTKSFYLSTKELPFAPLSTLTAAFRMGADTISPFPTVRSMSNTKFLYGIQSMLMDDFKLSLTKAPYMKKLLADFNGYNTKINNVSEDKFNGMLGYLGRAMNFYYDWKFFNGQVLNNVVSGAAVFGPVATLTTYQESNPIGTSIILSESINPLDSKNKVASYVQTAAVVAPVALNNMVAGENPRARVIMVNIIDLNIVPINVHSLMREIPLANLYNYALSFDTFIDGIAGINPMQKQILTKPYTKFNVSVDEAGVISVGTLGANAIAPVAPDDRAAGIAGSGGDSSLRFIQDILFNRLVKPGQVNADNAVLFNNRVRDRLNSKLVHNLTFLTLAQYAIKKKIKSEIDFVNSRVVSHTSAVSDLITNARTDIGDVNDDLFQF